MEPRVFSPASVITIFHTYIGIVASFTPVHAKKPKTFGSHRIDGNNRAIISLLVISFRSLRHKLYSSNYVHRNREVTMKLVTILSHSKSTSMKESLSRPFSPRRASGSPIPTIVIKPSDNNKQCVKRQVQSGDRGHFARCYRVRDSAPGSGAQSIIRTG